MQSKIQKKNIMQSEIHKFAIKSWNVNQKKTKIVKYVLGGTESSNVTILALQEFSWVNNPHYSYLDLQKVTNNYYHVIMNMCIVGVFSYNMGMSSPSKDIPRSPKYEEHGTLVIWNPVVFTFVTMVEPQYHKLKKLELGNRSSSIITLRTQDLKFLNVMNVHGHAKNMTKKDALFTSIFSQLSSCNIPTIICGDFNYEPKDVYRLLPQSLIFNSVNGITHINPNTKETFCIDHVVHNNFVTVKKLLISGIDQQNQSVKSLMDNKGHDHGMLLFTISI